MIQERFQQQTYATDNSCVWLSTALVINSIDNDEGDRLINAFKINPTNFDWLNINPKGGKDNICSKLKAVDSSYVSTKLKNVQRDKVLDYLMNIREGGLYVALLKAKIGEATHAVGINTFDRKIYDCMESRVMELNIDSLN